MLTISVDFNDIKAGRVTGLYSEVRGQNGRTARPGEGIFATDGEGNWCWGIVRDVHGGLVSVDLDLSTWATEAQPTLESSSDNRVANARLTLRGLSAGTANSGARLRGTRRVAVTP
jgi:hypothetical protein